MIEEVITQRMLVEIIIRDWMKIAAKACLNILVQLGHIEENQISTWDIKYEPEVAQKGMLAGTITDDSGKQIICVDPNVKLAEIIEVIAHETVHLMQYMKGEAKYYDANSIIWQGKTYQLLPANHPKYKEQFWEEEAFRLAPQIIKMLNLIEGLEMK